MALLSDCVKATLNILQIAESCTSRFVYHVVPMSFRLSEAFPFAFIHLKDKHLYKPLILVNLSKEDCEELSLLFGSCV